jgi:outer membrane cobalamin receptor
MRKITLFVIVYCLFSITPNLCSAEDLPTFQGNEIVVTAARHPQLLSESPWSITVLSSEALEKTGARSLGDALRPVLGMDIKSNGYQGSLTSMRLRGNSAEQVLVLVDGMRVSSPLLGVADFSTIPVHDIERVEVIRGASSALYGADAVGGVVNVITKKPSGGQKSELGLLYGTYGTGQVSFLTEGAGDAAYRFTCLLDKTDGFRDNSDSQSQNYSGTLNFLTDDGAAITFGGALGISEKGLPNVPTAESRPASASTPDDRQSDKNANLSLKYARVLEDGSDFELAAYQTQSDQLTRLFDFTLGDIVDTRYLSYTNAVELRELQHLDEMRTQTFGLDWREEIGVSDYAGKHSINNIALYFQDESNYISNLFLNIGVRGDRHSKSGDFISSRAGALYKITPAFHLRSSFATSFRSPTLNELYWNDPVWMMYGDEDLRPEKALVFDIGFTESLGGDGKLDLGYFAETVTDMIVWQYNPATFNTTAANIDSAVIQGFEWSLSRAISSWARYSANLTVQNPVRIFDERNPSYAGNDLPYCPRTKGNIDLTLGSQGGLVFYTAGRFTSDRFADGANQVKVPNYFVVDMRLSKEDPSSSWSFEVENAFDTVYYESVGNHPLTYAYMKYPMAGRRYVFGVKYKI